MIFRAILLAINYIISAIHCQPCIPYIPFADCFERLVLEATIPFERTFRTTDTNSVRVCENLCIAEGDKCQSFALGIHSKGNGTCQLSSIRIDQLSGRRPIGTVYDPDFDIYQRQLNCGISTSNLLPNGTTTNQ